VVRVDSVADGASELHEGGRAGSASWVNYAGRGYIDGHPAARLWADLLLGSISRVPCCECSQANVRYTVETSTFWNLAYND
jgi:hypothetical protein